VAPRLMKIFKVSNVAFASTSSALIFFALTYCSLGADGAARSTRTGASSGRRGTRRANGAFPSPCKTGKSSSSASSRSGEYTPASIRPTPATNLAPSGWRGRYDCGSPRSTCR
jgi:hypothetical protein